MPRVREIEDDGGDPTLKELFERERAVFGGLLNTTKVLAHCPPILRAAKQLGSEVQRRAMQLATLLEPLLIVAMGAVVLLIVLAVLLPIIQLNQWVR